MNTRPRRPTRYELWERIARGGMSEVWKALDTQLQRFVAIKLLHPDLQDDPSFITRFEREARVIASLHHPHIVQIYDFHLSRSPTGDDTVAYMVMEYVEGQTLAEYLRSTSRQGKFPSPADLLHLFVPICMAIDYAHQRHMIHRDIKPSNILLDKRGIAPHAIGNPILSDFGLAKLLGGSANSLSGWAGTPHYISPEQALGATADERSDLYSLAVILYETCTGTLPFEGSTPMTVVTQHVNVMPPSPTLINPNLSPALAAVIMRGLAKDPHARFSSACAMAVAMSEALNVPVPESLRQMTAMNSLTHHASGTSRLPSQSPALSNLAASLPAQAMVLPTHWPATSSPRGHAAVPLSSTGSDAGTPPTSSSAPQGAPASSSDSLPASAPSPSGSASIAERKQAPHTPTSSLGSLLARRHRGRIIVVLLLLLSSMASLVLLAYKNMTPSPTTSQVVGYAFFMNSGQLDADNSQGINDEILITLHHIPDPQAGKAYYAWLLADKSQSDPTTIPLGLLRVHRGSVSLLYRDNRHYNLLAYQSRFLVTEEDATIPPVTYSPDDSAWRYYAELSQAPSPQDKLHFSMLSHLRHLLAESPELNRWGLHGGIDMWFLRNTQKVVQWANEARDDWGNNPDLLHRHLVRILTYLDGLSYVQKDAPTVGASLFVDPHDAQVALLGPPPDGQDPPGYAFDDEVPPGYVYLVSSHLAGAMLSPDATPSQRQLAAHIHTAIDKVKFWLEQVHQDAKQLVVLTPAQLSLPSTLSMLDDMVTQTQLASSGQNDPLTGQQQGGVSWICSNIQRMANFEVRAYAASR